MYLYLYKFLLHLLANSNIQSGLFVNGVLGSFFPLLIKTSFTHFNSLGNIPDLKQLLYILSMSCGISSAASLKVSDGILLGPTQY